MNRFLLTQAFLVPLLFFGCASEKMQRAPAQIPNGDFERLRITDLRYVSKIPVQGSPDWMAIGYGSLWAPMNASMVRINPVTDELTRIPIDGGSYRGVQASGGFVWVFSTSSRILHKIDPVTNTVLKRTPLNSRGSSEGSIGSGFGSVWVVTQDGANGSDCLSRIEVESTISVACIPVDTDGNGVEAGEGSAWVTHFDLNQVTQINPATNQVVAKIPVGPGPRFIASGLGSVWTLNQGDGSVSRINPATHRVVATIAAGVPGGGGDIAVGEGSVWVTIGGVPVVKINPATNQVEKRYEGGSSADAIRAGLGFIWVSDRSTATIWKIKI